MAKINLSESEMREIKHFKRELESFRVEMRGFFQEIRRDFHSMNIHVEEMFRQANYQTSLTENLKPMKELDPSVKWLISYPRNTPPGFLSVSGYHNPKGRP